MQWELERYKRQLGLVHQRRLMDLNVALLGDGPVLPYVAINLALLGVGSGRGCIFLPVTAERLIAEHLEGQFFFKPEDEGLTISEAVAQRLAQWNTSVNVQLVEQVDQYGCDAILAVPGTEPLTPPSRIPVIWAGVTGYGLYVGAHKPQSNLPFSRNLLTPALASACGAIATQEMLRITRSIRVSEIEKFWLTLNYTVRPPVATEGGAGDKCKFSVGGFQAHPFKEVAEDQNPVYRVPVDLSNDYARLLFESTEIHEPTPPAYSSPVPLLYYSPFWANHLQDDTIIEQPVRLPPPAAPQRVILGGVGGIGTWFAALLAVSRYEGELVIFDGDTQIEKHNLNRQVLFEDQSIGLPKVEAAAHALRRMNAALTVMDSMEQIQVTTALAHSALMDGASLAVSTFDNFQARYILGEWAALEKVPLVNAGADGFDGDVEVVVPERNGCLFCFWEQEKGSAAAQAMKTAQDPLSCTREDANAPAVGRALVTTTAAMASLQALVSMLTLIRPEARFDHRLGYYGKDNTLEKCRLSSQNTSGRCPLHERGSCQHPQQFWRMLEEAILEDVE
jgi:molybdopterin/thiamine biosynthesis adenylyltransferase